LFETMHESIQIVNNKVTLLVQAQIVKRYLFHMATYMFLNNRLELK
jgi:hypothetical protein